MGEHHPKTGEIPPVHFGVTTLDSVAQLTRRLPDDLEQSLYPSLMNLRRHEVRATESHHRCNFGTRISDVGNAL